MKNDYAINHNIFIFCALLFANTMFAQSWDFIKEKDGVKLYSRQESGNKLETFKGVSEIALPIDKIFDLLEDVNNRNWWDKNLEQIKLLKYEKFKKSQYYLVYKMPWPFENRDMYVEVITTNNQKNGERKLTASPIVGVYPEIKNYVRIKNYRQQWTIRPLNQNLTQVELEFYVNPAEKLPNWLLNMILIETPINTINGLKIELKKQ